MRKNHIYFTKVSFVFAEIIIKTHVKESVGTMSINDLNNINNARQVHHYIQVNTPQTDKKMDQESNLFDTAPHYDQNYNQGYSLFPGTNEYDDEETAKQKEGMNFFL